MSRLHTPTTVENSPEGSRASLNAVAESNGCNYCPSAQTYLGRNVAKLDDAEITANRNGSSNDIKPSAAVRFTTQAVETRGHVSDERVADVKATGFDDAAVVEIVLTVALNNFTNYVNAVTKTKIDFPIMAARRIAA